MTDIVERLLSINRTLQVAELGREAAAEITRLREALEWISSNPVSHPSNMAMIARSALKGTATT